MQIRSFIKKTFSQKINAKNKWFVCRKRPKSVLSRGGSRPNTSLMMEIDEIDENAPEKTEEELKAEKEAEEKEKEKAEMERKEAEMVCMPYSDDSFTFIVWFY